MVNSTLENVGHSAWTLAVHYAEWQEWGELDWDSSHSSLHSSSRDQAGTLASQTHKQDLYPHPPFPHLLPSVTLWATYKQLACTAWKPIRKLRSSLISIFPYLTSECHLPISLALLWYLLCQRTLQPAEVKAELSSALLTLRKKLKRIILSAS